MSIEKEKAPAVKTSDAELVALARVCRVIEELDEGQRERVLAYVNTRYAMRLLTLMAADFCRHDKGNPLSEPYQEPATGHR